MKHVLSRNRASVGKVLPNSLLRRLPEVVDLPIHLSALWKSHGFYGLKLLDTRPNGFCGWYMLAFFSQLDPVSSQRMSLASQVQTRLQTLMRERCGVSFSNRELSCLLSAEIAGFYCDLIGYNLAVFSAKRYTTKHAKAKTDKWEISIPSYRADRNWLVAFLDTQSQIAHWQIVVGVKKKTRVLTPVFDHYELSNLIPKLHRDIDTCKRLQQWFKLDFKTQTQEYVFEDNEISESSTSDDESYRRPSRYAWKISTLVN